MPTKKEELALRWAMKSEEEKDIVRKKTAERVKNYRAGKSAMKRSEMSAAKLTQVRATEKKSKRKKREEMTDEQREIVRAKDRDRKAKDRKKVVEKEKNTIEGDTEQKKVETNQWERKKLKQLIDNCKTQGKLEAQKTEEEKEDIQVEKVRRMRAKRSTATTVGKKLARIHAKEGMREYRRFGYLREYKQRKRRDTFNPESWEMEPHAISEYFKKVKEVETDKERKENLKRMNRMRVERHREKIKKMLQEPVIIKDYGVKGEYELLREQNIAEFEKLKEASGLFD